MSYADEIKKILKNHYEWCKENGRDTSWYSGYKRVSTRKKVDQCSSGNTQNITKS
tara:strand:- start:773 stop:937 length:165 start_codon:yes stop_codon:yes gene_type:complete